MDAEKLRSFYADNFVDRDAALAEGAPDSVHELAMVLPSGDDKAIVYWRYKATNANDLFGMPTTETPRKFDIAGIEIFSVKDGRITDMWHVEEIAKLTETLTGTE